MRWQVSDLPEVMEEGKKLAGRLGSTKVKFTSDFADADGNGDDAWRKEIITRNPAMEDVLAKARLVAGSDVSARCAWHPADQRHVVPRNRTKARLFRDDPVRAERG